MQCTWTSMSLRSSRARYSTCTPAPPYTSGGYSRVRRSTLTPSGLDDFALADDDDPTGRDVEAPAVLLGVDADARAVGDPHVLVDDRALDDGVAADLDARHLIRLLAERGGGHAPPRGQHRAPR